MYAKQSLLVAELKSITLEAIAQANEFSQQPLDVLNWKASSKSWSVLECLEHLNLYGDFYIPEIESRLLKASEITTDAAFKSGWLGNYFANSMWPKSGKIKPMATFKDKDPANSKLPLVTLDRFIKQQERFIQLLEMASSVNMAKVKTGISITSIIKLRLGDTFRFVIAHNQRHLHQAQKVLKSQENLVLSK